MDMEWIEKSDWSGWCTFTECVFFAWFSFDKPYKNKGTRRQTQTRRSSILSTGIPTIPMFLSWHEWLMMAVLLVYLISFEPNKTFISVFFPFGFSGWLLGWMTAWMWDTSRALHRSVPFGMCPVCSSSKILCVFVVSLRIWIIRI